MVFKVLNINPFPQGSPFEGPAEWTSQDLLGYVYRELYSKGIWHWNHFYFPKLSKWRGLSFWAFKPAQVLLFSVKNESYKNIYRLLLLSCYAFEYKNHTSNIVYLVLLCILCILIYLCQHINKLTYILFERIISNA